MNTDTCWFTNIRHCSSLSKLLLFYSFIFGCWQLNPHRFSLNFALTLLQWLVQEAWLRLLILKQPKHNPPGTCSLPQLPDEPGLLIPPGWCSHFPVAVVAAPCWGRSAGGVQHDWVKTRRKPWQNLCVPDDWPCMVPSCLLSLPCDSCQFGCTMVWLGKKSWWLLSSRVQQIRAGDVGNGRKFLPASEESWQLDIPHPKSVL